MSDKKMSDDYIEKTNKTLGLVRNLLNGIEFAVVGSFARHTLREEGQERFSPQSDLDIAVAEGQLEDARARFSSTYGYDAARGLSYNARVPPFQSYRITGDDITSIHLVGPLGEVRNTRRENIRGTDYALKDLTYVSQESY